jgi:uncharacterized membrane protein YtjA (UPF0391 family)
MIQAAISFFVLSIIAMIIGATGIAGVSFEIAKIFLIVFLLLAVISFFASMFTGRRKGFR